MRYVFDLVLGLELEVGHVLNWFVQYFNAELFFYRWQDVLVFSHIFLFPAFDQVINGMYGCVSFVNSWADIRWCDLKVIFHALNCREQNLFTGTCGLDSLTHFIEVESKRYLAQLSFVHNRNKSPIHFFMGLELKLEVFVFHHFD